MLIMWWSTAYNRESEEKSCVYSNNFNSTHNVYFCYTKKKYDFKFLSKLLLVQCHSSAT